MKVAILAGGFGTRLSEYTDRVPKPMVEIGGRPILWHIMRNYAAQGYKEFVLALGYKGHLIKDFFLNYHARSADCTVDLASGSVLHHGGDHLDWQVTLVDTGIDTMTGGRVKRLSEHLGDEFFLTYGDGLSDVSLERLLALHRARRSLVTVTAVHPSSRYGKLEIFAEDQVSRFVEKPEFAEDWINGGFFVMRKEFLHMIADDATVLEREPLEQASAAGRLHAYQHAGFWQCMDTVRDLKLLEEHWYSGRAPWKNW